MDKSTTTNTTALDGHELRQRLPQNPDKPRKAESVDVARDVVMQLNTAENKSGKAEKDKRTYGRTPDGTVFTVPQTHDMVSQLLSPTQPKNLSDMFVIVILLGHVALLYLLPSSLKVPSFAVIFLFWRACYNGGIGYLLKEQSNGGRLVSWAKRSRIFESPSSSGSHPHPTLYKFLKREMETKIPRDYKFEDAPIEYNTWLTFRRIVDLVLMCDFTSYVLFAFACSGNPPGEHLAMTIGRWIAGLILFFFNLWVKLDAHRVVKDYAWYWGDFFFLMDQELTFDGVFEMAPHPMYSVGYAGFYGISLMAASYKVLFISIVGHAAQFAFLALVENPHIDKTYNPPPPRRRTLGPSDLTQQIDDGAESPHDVDFSIDDLSPVLTPTALHASPQAPPQMRDLVGLKNLDLYRVTDVASILIQLYLYALAILTPSTRLYQAVFVMHAVAWRLWYSIGIGYVLHSQSKRKSWTRHFIKWGESTEEAWRQWKGFYHISMTMCYVSFAMAAYKMYTLPIDWEYDMVLLRHVLGMGLIALHLWTVISIYESLGEFGWFFGDFFFKQGPNLTYGGIYRFLNNPERVLGLAGIWGLAIITWSKAIFFLALLSHALTLLFLEFVERPHMQKRYGQSVRQHSGLTKSVKKSLPRQFQEWQGSVDKYLDNTAEIVEEFIESAAPKLAAGVDHIVKDTRALFQKYPARLSITRLAPDLAGYDRDDYSVEFEGTVSTEHAHTDKASGREGEYAQSRSAASRKFQPSTLEYGAPIKVKWTAPVNHSKQDWIGLYMLADNTSKDVTRINSQGRWIATSRNVFDSARADEGILISDKQIIEWKNEKGRPLMTGEMEFSGDKLWWTTGVFEFRYHHDGKHNVMAISKPFEIRIAKFGEYGTQTENEGSTPTAIERVLLPVVRNCFDRDPEIAPNTVDEAFGALVERDGKFARRVVFAVGQMFGIEFAPEVVKSDGNVRNLAWRISNAKKVLERLQAPYSMSQSGGRNTPTEIKEN